MSNAGVSDWDVLIVDDEPDNLSVLEMILMFYDARVTSTLSGQEALRLLAEGKFKVALVDLQMPIVSGWDIVRHVRTSPVPEVRSMTLIAVTAQAMQDTRERVLASGFDDYVVKPIEVPTFLQTIVDAVQKRSVLDKPAQIPSTISDSTAGQAPVPGPETSTAKPPSKIEESTPTQAPSTIGEKH